MADGTGENELTLQAPEAVPAVQADKAAGLVPLDDKVRDALQARVADFVADLVDKDANSPEFGQQIDRLAIGRAHV